MSGLFNNVLGCGDMDQTSLLFFFLLLIILFSNCGLWDDCEDNSSLLFFFLLLVVLFCSSGCGGLLGGVSTPSNT